MADTPKPDIPVKTDQPILDSNATQETPAVPDGSPPPDMSTEEIAALAGEGAAALHDIGDDGLEPPAPFDIPIPDVPEKDTPQKETEQAAPGKTGDEEALRKEQEDLQSALDAKAADFEKSQPRKAPAAKADQSAAKRGRPPKADKAAKAPDKSRAPVSPEHEKAMADYKEALAEWESKQPWERSAEPPKKPKPPKAPKKETAKKEAAPASKEPEPPPPPPAPREAPRSAEPEQVVFIKLSELHPFKDHPFGVRDDAEMRSLVESVREKGVNQPALVRPRPEGGYEIVAGHRRQKASELAGFTDMRCIVREMTDDEAILAMTDDNLRQRSEILPSEKAISLKMQVEAIKHQGARSSDKASNPPAKDKGSLVDAFHKQLDQKLAGQRSVDIVGERNGMNSKQVQRYIRLTELVPDLMKAVDEKKIGFTPAVEFSFIKPKNQNLIAVSLEGQQNSPSLSQAQKMRELDKEGKLNGDVIDGILCQEKKEVDKVIISGEELHKYFGKEQTPREMKDQIIKLLDEWSEKEKGLAKPEKKPDLEK